MRIIQLRYSSPSYQQKTVVSTAELHGISIREPIDTNGHTQWVILEEKRSPADLSNFANELGLEGVRAQCILHDDKPDDIGFNVTYTSKSGQREIIERIAAIYKIAIHINWDRESIIEWSVQSDRPLSHLSNFANELGYAGVAATCFTA